MDASRFQAEVNDLLVEHGLRDASGKAGLETVRDERFGSLSLHISSIAQAKVRPHTEWAAGTALIKLQLDRGAQPRPRMTGWDDRGIPFDFMSVKFAERGGAKYTLELLDDAFAKLSQKLDRQLPIIRAEDVTLTARCALLDLYHASGCNLLVRDGGYISAEALRWVAAGIRGDVIVYAFADPFCFSTLTRKHRRPVFEMAAALELRGVPLARIAALYPLAELGT